jgi:hypothetical protein
MQQQSLPAKRENQQGKVLNVRREKRTLTAIDINRSVILRHKKNSTQLNVEMGFNPLALELDI